MRRFLLLLGLLCLFAAPAKSQFLGYTSPQTISQKIFTAASCPATATIQNVGQSVHSVFYTVTGIPAGSAMSILIEGSYDNVTFKTISDVGTDQAGGIIQASGYYPVIRVNVGSCGTGSVTAFYAGTSVSNSDKTGSIADFTAYRKSLFTGASAGSNQSVSVSVSPYGNVNGVLLFNYSGAGITGSTFTINCTDSNVNGAAKYAAAGPFTIASSGALQTFLSGAFPCQNVTFDYASGGASAQTFNAVFYFNKPGVANPTATAAAAGAGQVQGTAPAGSVPSGNPVYVGGTDGTNIQGLSVDTSGRAKVVGAAASGTAKAGNPLQDGGVFNTTQPTVTSGQEVEAQYTARGGAIVATGTDPFSVRATGNTGATLDAAGQNAASPPNELLVAGQFNTTPTTIASGNVSPLQLDSAGNLLVKTAAGSSTCGTGASACQVQGTVAEGGTAANNPVRVAGAGADSVLRTLPINFSSLTTSATDSNLSVGGKDTANKSRTLQTDASGNLAPANASGSGGDSQSNTQAVPTTAAGATLYFSHWAFDFNGTTWDRKRGNTNGSFTQGPAARGAAPVGNPLFLAGWDGTNLQALIAAADTNQFNVLNPPPLLVGGIGGANGSANGNARAITACDQTAFINATTATTTQIVALSGSQRVRVCSFSISNGGTPQTLIFKYGTGVACGTGTTTLTATFTMASRQTVTQGTGLGELFQTTAGQALCATNSSATQIGVTISYSQY